MVQRRWMLSAVAAAMVTACVGGRVCGEPVLAESCDDPGAWRAVAADGVAMRLSRDGGAGGEGDSLRLDYDFARGSGYAIARLDLVPPIEAPANYAVRFRMRGEGPSNTLEVKLVEPVQTETGAGENVWWVNRRDEALAGPWREMTLPKRLFTFAWGPAGGKPLEKIGAVEIVVTSFNGGKGTVWIDDLVIEARPETQPYVGTPRVTVSSRGDGAEGALAINGEGFLGWRSAGPESDAAPEAVIDFGEPRELGGVRLEWDEGLHAEDYELAAEDEGGDWRTLAAVHGSNGGRDYLVAPGGAVASRVRVKCLGERTRAVGLRSVTVLEPEIADDPNRLPALIAADSPRGHWPRYWIGEAWYWTVVGADRDELEALVSEDGMIELAKAGPSLEPFIFSGGRLLTWNEMPATQNLDDGYLPIPTVARAITSGDGEDGLRLEVTCLVDDAPPVERGRGVLLARYRVTNTGRRSLEGRLFIAARPNQVNPVYQFLNTTGGAAKVGVVAIEGSTLRVDGLAIVAMEGPEEAGAVRFEQGEIVEHLATGRVPAEKRAEDASGRASGAIGYLFRLGPGESKSVHLVVPLHAGDALPAEYRLAAEGGSGAGLFDKRRAVVAAEWRERLNRVPLSFPSTLDGERLANLVRSNLAYILINRDGPAIQPGSRSYERTWIRDGALTSAALLRLGHAEVVREFLDWFGPYQYDNGKVPCCVDRRGPDPVPEHDSHGEYIFAVMNYFRHTGDKALLRRHWERVRLAAGYMESLRAERMTDAFSPEAGAPLEKAMLYGLLPESISHEGYSAKPMHSYWDDFWALKGLEDAAEMARVLGEDGEAARLGALAGSFRETLRASIERSMAVHGIDYIPGCADLGDFDATSTTIAVWPCGHEDWLPAAALAQTFEKYWRFFESRRMGTGEAEKWEAYTPYEWRTVGTLARLGEHGRAAEAIDYFLGHSRPAGWNHWAEVVWRDERRPAFIGDMPHTWVGADFINAVMGLEEGR